ncbi:MAG: futalosine hydrolase [Mariniblastus sp.]|jgi:futalosine hydrolase
MPESESKWLVLVPTEFELKFISSDLEIPNSQVAVCGFGPVVAAARTMQLVGMHCPDRILLLGIAGSYDPAVGVGSACEFSKVACYGIGAGGGADFQTSGEMGWSQWPSQTPERTIGDQLPLQSLQQAGGQLLTVCSAAGNQDEVASRREKFPGVFAEDMEGFGVAAAGRLSGTPVSIVRGISNLAGDRNKSNWEIGAALAAAVEYCHRALG